MVCSTQKSLKDVVAEVGAIANDVSVGMNEGKYFALQIAATERQTAVLERIACALERLANTTPQ